jgi:hypothetical protein
LFSCTDTHTSACSNDDLISHPSNGYVDGVTAAADGNTHTFPNTAAWKSCFAG